MATSDFAIESAGLTKYFGDRKVVDTLDLAVPRGSVYAFLGRNGAGKTTTIRMLLGFLRPTRGRSRVLGHDSRSLPPLVRGRIGYVASTHPLHEWMTVKEEAWFASQFAEQWNATLFQSIMGHFGVRAGARGKDLSRGERAGLSVAIALAAEPELLILDEPTLGLDPVARRAIMEQVQRVTGDSRRTVFLSSHQLEDVVHLADHVAVLDHGGMHAAGSMDALASSVTRFRLRFIPGSMPTRIPEIPGLVSTKRTDETLILTVVGVGARARSAITGLAPEAVTESAVPALEALLSYLGPAADHPTAAPPVDSAEVAHV